MFKPFLILPVLALFGAPAFFQQKPAAPAAPAPIPAEYATMTIPVRPTAELQTRAKKMYGWDCAMCHGENGNGKGDMAAQQKLAVRDFRDPAALKQYSDGQLFYIIKNGRGQMPSEGDRANDELIWNMVIYVRKLAQTPSGTAAASAQQ